MSCVKSATPTTQQHTITARRRRPRAVETLRDGGVNMSLVLAAVRGMTSSRVPSIGYSRPLHKRTLPKPRRGILKP